MPKDSAPKKKVHPTYVVEDDEGFIYGFVRSETGTDVYEKLIAKMGDGLPNPEILSIRKLVFDKEGVCTNL